jgi:hypothetical protein
MGGRLSRRGVHLRLRLHRSDPDGKSSVGLRSARLVIGTSLYGAELIGAVLIITGRLAGLYLATTSMIILLAFMISGAWLLIIGASAREPDQARH